jgi:hypothetical protein
MSAPSSAVDVRQTNVIKPQGWSRFNSPLSLAQTREQEAAARRKKKP